MNKSSIEDAVKWAGSEAKLARLVGCSQPLINKAKRAGQVSPRLAAQIHKATDGAIPMWNLRPDLFESPADNKTTH